MEFAPLPTVEGGFRVVVADVPSLFKSNSDAKPGRNPRRHYACLKPDDLARLPVRDVVASDAVLFFWTTGPLLVTGYHIPIMRAWGFAPCAMGFVWIKLNPKASTPFDEHDLFMGGGFTTRKNAEFVIMGKRGRSLRRSNKVREVIISPRREHSRKPDDTFDRVEEYAAGPYLELFARAQRPNWHCWGLESDKFTGAQQ